MECNEAKTRAIENARDPIRNEVYELISNKITSHVNVVDDTFTVKYYLPYQWEVKTIERRKTVDGEEKIIMESHIECPELDWLVKELKEKKYEVVFKEESGWVYGKTGYLEIKTSK